MTNEIEAAISELCCGNGASEPLPIATPYPKNLRDWFAGQALTGLCSTIDPTLGEPLWGELAMDSYKAADAMMEARQK